MKKPFLKIAAVTLLLSASVAAATWVSVKSPKSGSRPVSPVPGSPVQVFLPNSAHTVFDSPTKNYSFEYPKDWSVTEIPQCCVVINSKPDKMPANTVEIFINRWPNISKKYVDVQTWAKAIEIEHISPTSLGARTAARGVQALGDISGVYYIGAVLVIDKNDGYEISYDPLDTLLLPDVNRLLSSFKFKQ
ncbi:MAG: hypothetical protein ACJ71U_15500 [Terriglobales bacterium]